MEYTICHFKVKNLGKQVKLFTFFSKLLEDHQLSLNQIFNCDEIRLNFRLLPDKTLAASFQKSTVGRKMRKGRVTINACANATGTINLPLQVIGKAKCPRCFRGMRMDYRVLWPETCMDELCEFYCLVSFVPLMCKQLSSLTWLKKSSSGTG